MRIYIPDIAIGLPMVLVWLTAVGLCVLAYFLVRWWRRRHPLPSKPAEPSYSRGLTQRFAARGGAKAKDTAHRVKGPPA